MRTKPARRGHRVGQQRRTTPLPPGGHAHGLGRLLRPDGAPQDVYPVVEGAGPLLVLHR